MFESIGRSWNLMKSSYSVLKSDKELLVFPLISAVLGLLAAITFFLPVLLFDLTESVLLYPVIFLFYFVTYFIVIFFNSALIGAAMIRLKGGDPTVSDGLNIAMANLGNIVAWAAVAATVGMILRALAGKSRNNLVGRIAIAIIGGAWSIITYFVIPVLVFEKVGPLEAVKRSAFLVKDRFGEYVIGSMGLGVANMILAFATLVIVGIPALGLFLLLGPVGLIPAIIMLVTAFVILSIVMSALNSIYVAALYHYAKTGKEPANWKIGEIVHSLEARQPGQRFANV